MTFFYTSHLQKHCSLSFKPSSCSCFCVRSTGCLFSEAETNQLLLHELKTLSAQLLFRTALWFVSPVRFQPLFSALRTLSSIFLKTWWRERKKKKPRVLQLWETCCFAAWKPPGPVNTGRPLSQPWKCRGGVQCKLMETFMKANKDKAWQENGCRAFFLFFYFLQCEARPVTDSMSLILFLSLTTLNLKNIQGIYSYTRSANYKSANTLLKNK